MTEWKPNPPADDDAIAAAEKIVGLLPEVYRRYLRETNGGVGVIQNLYLALWRVEELAEANEGYQAKTALPGVVLIGSDGGNEGFGLDVRVDPSPVVMAPLIVLDWADARVVNSDFATFWRDIGHGYDPIDVLTLSGALESQIRSLADDLVTRQFDRLVADGRIGRLAPADLQRELDHYPSTFVPITDTAWLHLLGGIGLYEYDLEPGTYAIDVPLWSEEEGRSALEMRITAKKSGDDYRLSLDDLLVP